MTAPGVMTAAIGADPSDCLTDEGRAALGATFGIGRAVHEMRNGNRVARTGWNGKGMWLALQTPDANSKMGLPYVYMKTATGPLVPWLCSQTDLLAEDWGVVT